MSVPKDLLSLVMAKMPVFGAHGIATSVTMDISVSRKYAVGRGVTNNSSLRRRILALKGAKMGVISLGSAPDLYSRWLIGTVGKVVRALARDNNFVQDNTEETKKVLGKRFARLRSRGASHRYGQC